MSGVSNLPEYIEAALKLADPTWQVHLRSGLSAMVEVNPRYFADLEKDTYFPTDQRLFSAFAQPLSGVRYVLLGEGPYPRQESATGYCFIDGAVKLLWQPGKGLAKQVNRATSLRNFIKMLLVADGVVHVENTTGTALASVADMACAAHSGWITTAAELQANLLSHGFLLLNASLVFRESTPPAVDAKAWIPFLRIMLSALAAQNTKKPKQVKLILWGKMAEKIKELPEAIGFDSCVSEHPYNISFIKSQQMQMLFKHLNLLKK